MFFSDHAPPHFHAEYAEHEALVTIETLEVLRGELPPRALALVLEWAAVHREDLRTDWNRARSGQTPRTNRATRIGRTHVSGAYSERHAISGSAAPTRTDGRHDHRARGGALLKGPVFKEIREKPELFAQAQAKGGTVVWPNGADLCPDVLIWGGAPPLTPLPGHNAS